MHVKNVLASRDYSSNYSIESNKVTSIVTIDRDKTVLTKQQARSLMATCMDLVDDRNYLPFFFNRLSELGPAAFIRLADHARKYGKQPSRLFVKMLHGETH